jgi:integrase
MRDLTDTGIVVRPHKTIHTRRTRRVFEWTPALEESVSQAKAARPIDFSPWLFCTSKGKGYFNEDSGQATGWDSMWQRFMRRLLKDTKITERFTEHDLRGKVGSDLASIERAADLLRHASRQITKRHYRRKPEVIKPVRWAALLSAKIRIVTARSLAFHLTHCRANVRMGDCESVIRRLFAASNHEFD